MNITLCLLIIKNFSTGQSILNNYRAYLRFFSGLLYYITVALLTFPLFAVYTHAHHHFILLINEALNFALLVLISLPVPVVFTEGNVIHVPFFSAAIPGRLASPILALVLTTTALVLRKGGVGVVSKQPFHVGDAIVDGKLGQGVGLIGSLFLVKILAT